MTTNVVDLEWVPVTKGGSETVVSLRSALREAHTVEHLGASLLPVEREALLRLLESLTAAVLHHADPARLAAEQRIPSDDVDRFFAAHKDVFDLADPARPFLQEWHTPAGAATAKGYRPVQQLHLRVPGGSSATWGVSAENRDAADPRVLVLLLAVAWFHGKPSNAAGADFYRPTSGSKRSPISGAPSGGTRDTAFHLIGSTLAQTLLLNIPMDWLGSEFGPAWLDQDAAPTPNFYARPGTLWRCTWTANRTKIRWEGGQPTGFTVGLTQRMIPTLGDLTKATTDQQVCKANAKAVAGGDYCRPVIADPKNPGSFSFVKAPPGLNTAEGYEQWYRAELSEALKNWVDGTQRTIDVPRTVVLGFHNEEGDTYGNRHWSRWTEVPLAQLTVVGEPALALRAVTAHAGPLARAVSTALRAELLEDKKRPVTNTVKAAVYAALDEPVLSAVAEAADGTVVDAAAIRRDMTHRAVHAFTAATEALMTPAACAAVYRARATYRRLAHHGEDS